MLHDKQASLLDGAVTVSFATDVYDTLASNPGGNLNRNLGNEDLEIVIDVKTTLTAAGAATLVLTVRSDTSSNPAAPAAVVDHIATLALTVASLVKGRRIAIPFPYDSGNPYKRYVHVAGTVATGPFTAGALKIQVSPRKNADEP